MSDRSQLAPGAKILSYTIRKLKGDAMQIYQRGISRENTVVRYPLSFSRIVRHFHSPPGVWSAIVLYRSRIKPLIEPAYQT
jgi:hypothetical protein